MKIHHIVVGALLTMSSLTDYNVYIRGVTFIDRCPSPEVEEILLTEQADFDAEATIVISGAICKPENANEDVPRMHGTINSWDIWGVETDGTVGIHVDLQ